MIPIIKSCNSYNSFKLIANFNSENGVSNKIDLHELLRQKPFKLKDGFLEYWSGGGIVADSDPEMEYKECYLKADRLLGLI